MRSLASQFHQNEFLKTEIEGEGERREKKFGGRPAREVGAQNFMQHKVSSNYRYLIQPYILLGRIVKDWTDNYLTSLFCSIEHHVRARFGQRCQVVIDK